MHNLHGDPAFATLTRTLAARLAALRRETADHYVYQPTVMLKRETAELPDEHH
jgi:hypothetical protein